MSYMFFQWRLVAASVAVLLVMATICRSQETDLIEWARANPPAQWTGDQRSQFESAVEWRIAQIKSVHDELKEARDNIRADLDKITREIEAHESELPRELRFLNEDGRSQLATHILQVLLDTRLDLAVNQEVIARLEERQPERNEERIAQHELDVLAAQKESELKAKEIERLAKLHISGAATSIEIERAKASAEIAALKVKSARAALDMSTKEREGAKANQLAELRVQQKPLEAKLESADAFLNTLQDSSERLRKIEQYRRERELVMRDLAWVAGELGPLSREMLELENLSKLVKAASGVAPAKGDQQPTANSPASPSSE